ncbi:hypothetical protein GCM10022221_67740 [Actinocorallia aurea]
MTGTRTKLPTDQVTQENAWHVLHTLGGPDTEGGYAAGHVTVNVIRSLRCAYPSTVAKFQPGFPGLIQAVALYESGKNGIKTLQRIAQGDPDRPAVDVDAPSLDAVEGEINRIAGVISRASADIVQPVLYAAASEIRAVCPTAAYLQVEPSTDGSGRGIARRVLDADRATVETSEALSRALADASLALCWLGGENVQEWRARMRVVADDIERLELDLGEVLADPPLIVDYTDDTVALLDTNATLHGKLTDAVGALTSAQTRIQELEAELASAKAVENGALL